MKILERVMSTISLYFWFTKNFFSLASYSQVMDTHFVGENRKTNHSHWKRLFYYSKRVTSRLVIHSAIHCTRDRNSSLQIPNYTKPAQISSQNDNLLIFGHLQALCSNIKVMKANNLLHHRSKHKLWKPHGWSRSLDRHNGGTEGREPTNCYLTHLLYMGAKLKDSS